MCDEFINLELTSQILLHQPRNTVSALPSYSPKQHTHTRDQVNKTYFKNLDQDQDFFETNTRTVSLFSRHFKTETTSAQRNAKHQQHTHTSEQQNKTSFKTQTKIETLSYFQDQNTDYFFVLEINTLDQYQ